MSAYRVLLTGVVGGDTTLPHQLRTVYPAGMDSRTARRAAEKAARDLIATRAALVGELGVAAAERTQLIADVTTATDRGRELIAAAEAEAAHLVAAARHLVADGEQRYTDAYTAATTAGWTPADLTALGYPPATTNTARRRRQAPADQAAAASEAAAVAVPEQQPAPAATPSPAA
jgi:hypothetical protein